MAFEIQQFRDYVVRPVLEELGLYSAAAERLVIGTAAHESGGFRFLHQMGNGPAVSFFQIEPVTYRDLMERTVQQTLARKNPTLVAALYGMMPRRFAGYPPAEYLMRDLGFATACCRLLYYRVPDSIPAVADLPGLAAYWKAHYNTTLGAGTPTQWLNSYQLYVAPRV